MTASIQPGVFTISHVALFEVHFCSVTANVLVLQLPNGIICGWYRIRFTLALVLFQPTAVFCNVLIQQQPGGFLTPLLHLWDVFYRKRRSVPVNVLRRSTATVVVTSAPWRKCCIHERATSAFFSVLSKGWLLAVPPSPDTSYFRCCHFLACRIL